MFSSIKRSETVTALQNSEFDLLIIGGGITGVGIALDAVGRGLKVALVEKQDFAAGTSSRSTKLIHGGLRYLKQLDFALVREVGQERAIVYRNAPHLVWPEKMVLPIIEGGSLGKFATSWALKLYEWLANVPSKDERVMLDKEATLKEEPLLESNGLLGSAIYSEYRTDDARLVIEVAKTAALEGALLINYAEVSSLLYENNRISGAMVANLVSGESFEVKAKMVVNAAGPWVDGLRRMDGKVSGKKLHLTKGVHLVFDRNRLPLNHSVYFDVGDARMMFAIPRGQATYVGTTDTNYTHNKERPHVLVSEVKYILDAINRQFNIEKLTKKDVRSSWAGLRPLIHQEGKSPSELSRKDEIFESERGLISIAGGKLTGYRMMSLRTVDLVCEQITDPRFKNAKSTTEHKKLSGSNFPNGNIEQLVAQFDDGKLNRKRLLDLARRYGANMSVVYSNIDVLLLKESEEKALLLAELKYCVENEMVTELSDFMIRRSGRLYFDRGNSLKHLQWLNARLAALLNWDENSAKSSLAVCEKEYKSVLNFEV